MIHATRSFLEAMEVYPRSAIDNRSLKKLVLGKVSANFDSAEREPQSKVTSSAKTTRRIKMKCQQFIIRKLWWILYLFYFSNIQLASGSKILILHPLYSGSHVLTLRTVAESLAQRGHRIHIVKWKDAHVFPAQNNANITVTTLAMDNSQGQHAFLTQEKRAAFQVPFDILWNSGLTFKAVLDSYKAFPLMGAHCDTLMSNQKIRKELKHEKFDLAIIDILYNECGLALLHNLKIPSVGYWAFPFASGEADYTTAFLPPSHVPTFLSKLGHEMTFLQRTYNTIMKLSSHLVMWVHCYIVDFYVQKHIPGTPHPFQLLKNMNGMLINTDYSLDYPRLLPPTFINVGGMQIRRPNPLDPNIEAWMESSGEHGVVLFTMGFIFNPKVVPKVLINAFMKAFSRLPQKFLVKFDGPIDFVPSNVKVLDWIPQQDVLAHPKTKVFLTHCGLHGVMEGIYYGVPMVGMPIFIDQGDILIKMKEKGIAQGFNKENTTADEIYETLREVLYNPSYKQNVMKLSALMRDVNETPLERVISLLEYLIRHQGAEHLKLSSRHLSFLQYFSIDTLAFLLILSIICLYLQYKIAKLVLRKIHLFQVIKNVILALLPPEAVSGKDSMGSTEPLIKPSEVLRSSIKNTISDLDLYSSKSPDTLKYDEAKKRI